MGDDHSHLQNRLCRGRWSHTIENSRRWRAKREARHACSSDDPCPNYSSHISDASDERSQTAQIVDKFVLAENSHRTRNDRLCVLHASYS